MVQATHTRIALASGWAAAAVCAVGAWHGKWLDFPLSRQLRGSHYSIGSFSPDGAPFTPFSFGCVAVVLIVWGAVAFQGRRWRLLGWMGALLLWLALYGGLKPGLTDAPLLQTLETESTQQQSAAAYSQQALPVNFGGEPSVWPRIDLDTIEDRLVAAWYFLHSGWWAALAAGLLALSYSAGRDPRGRLFFVTGAGAAALLLGCAAGPILGEWTLMRAHAAEARGDTALAAREYRQSMRYDAWLALRLDLYADLGSLDGAAGDGGTPEYHVYHAQLASTQMDLPAALAELRTARLSTHDATLGEAIRKRESELYTQYARNLHALGAYGAAVAASQRALELNPASLLPAFYLSRDFFLVGRWREAAELSEQVLPRVDDPTFRANLFSNAGDAYTMLGSYSQAKLAYRNSYLLDYVLNLRGLAALNGPAEDAP